MNKPNKPSLLGRLRAAQSFLENHQWSKDAIQNEEDFISLPAYRQMAIRKEWDEYYAKTNETMAYQRFVAQKEAMGKATKPYLPDKEREKNRQKVRDYAEDARTQLVNGDFELVKPQGRDPWEYENNNYIMEYKTVLRKIKEEQLENL